jgi:FPC/CPF motif-containing protein YcgG
MQRSTIEMEHDRLCGHASSAIYGNNDTPSIMSYTFRQQDETINAHWRLVPNRRHLATYGGGIAHEQL